MTKYLIELNLKEESCIWPIISKISVHGHLALLLVGLRQDEYHSGEHMVQGMAAGKQGKRERGEDGGWRKRSSKICPSKAHPQRATFSR